MVKTHTIEQLDFVTLISGFTRKTQQEVFNRLDIIVCVFSCQMWFISCYLKSNEVSQKFKQSVYILSDNAENKVRITFNFSLYTISLQVVLVVYFRRELDELRDWDHYKIARCIIANTRNQSQFWSIFRIRLLQYKLLVYILSILPRIAI